MGPPRPGQNVGPAGRVTGTRTVTRADKPASSETGSWTRLPSTFVGIDVAKHSLDIHLRPPARASPSTTTRGVAALVGRLAALAPALVVLEATGGMEVRLAAALAAAGLPVAVVNPRQVRAFARATGRLAKTDRPGRGGDRPLRRGGPAAGAAPADEATRHLGRLVARRRSCSRCSWRAQPPHAADPPCTGGSTPTSAGSEEALAEIERRPRPGRSATARLAGQGGLLRSVPGVGPVSARTLLAELPSSARSPAARPPPWSGWRRSAATAARRAAGARSGAAGRPCGRASTWPRSRPRAAATRRSPASTSGSAWPGSRPSSR
jgi:transposase